MMDRPFSRFLAVCGVAALASTPLATAATPSAKQALAIKPIQPGVSLNPLAVDQVSVRDIKSKTMTGWEVIDANGAIARRFADTNGDKKMDLWCYFNGGIEVYRDIDQNFNGRPDQYRWFGTLGSRWGIDPDENGKIDRWKQISPEEVTAEVVAALRDGDPDRFAALVLSRKELQSLGLGKEKTELLGQKSQRALKDFAALAKRQSAIGKDAQWVQFAAPLPGVVPAGTDGSVRDVTAYENAVAMFAQGDQDGQVLVGTLVKSDSAWRVVDLPSLGADGEGIAQSSGNLFSPAGIGSSTTAVGGVDERTQQLVTKLEALDAELASVKTVKQSAPLHARRADVIEALVAAASNAEERDTWVRQLVDTMSIAVQSGAYPEGIKRMTGIASKFGKNDKSLASYADYAAISSQYVVRQTPEADFAKVQQWYLDSLEGFVKRYPRTIEAAKSGLQLALAKEFDENESDALEHYKKVASGFSGTDEGFKAAGAIRRLESVGRRIELEGRTVDGKPFRLSTLKGKPVVIHYWATWCEPCKQDMQLLRRLQAAYARSGLQLVGVNVDSTEQQAVKFIKEARLPWTQLFEPGGLEGSSLANRLGVQTLPTMLLIDQDGKVVRHNVRAAELDTELQKLVRRKRK